ncbi:heme peroxidase [Xylogone sp. PMI_703]|nr:heme peroxidase [Xylogone sp. PMI_703]
MRLSSVFGPFALLLWWQTVYSAFWYPNPLYSSLETILVQTHGAFASGFVNAITPCSNYVSGSQTLGRETAAQWLRVAFHDYVTANVTAGTGGIDASIGFETLREENSGSAFNDSFAFFAPYVNAQISMADLVAMSVVISVGNCQGPQIPARGGRIDATGPGTSGVPAPDTDLSTTLLYFARSGFNQADAIRLTACGHTMGNVHHTGFPTVVGESAVTPNNTGGGVHLDTTPDAFDDNVVQEYVSWTGQMGGPLVTSFNVSSRSDLRLYESDANATMLELASQKAGFVDTCVGLLQRMIETVPKGVTLSEVIKPLSIKPINSTLDLDSHGNLQFSGVIRVLHSTTASPPKTLYWSHSGSVKSVTLTPSTETGTSVFGNMSFYTFNIPIQEPKSFNSFTISGSGIESQKFTTQANTIIVPSMTYSSQNASTKVVNVGAAALKSAKRNNVSPLEVIVAAPVPQQGTLAPKIHKWTVSMEKSGSTGEYDLSKGTVDIGALTTGAVTVDILVAGQLQDKYVIA